jgi:hypothetical protein
MADKNRTDIRKTDFLVIRSQQNDDIVKIVTPQYFQVGLPGETSADTDFDKSLIIYGNVNASSFIASNTYVTASQALGAPLVNTQLVKSIALTGSLTKLSDGSSYLKEGSNITIATGSDGQITIGASGFSNNPLTIGDGLALSQGTTYDGSAAKTISSLAYTNYGLSVTAPSIAAGGGGIRIDFGNLPTAQVATDDRILFGDASLSGAPYNYAPRYTTVADILALGGAGSHSILTMGQAIQLGSGASTFNGSLADTVLLATSSAGGLEVSSDALKIKLDAASLQLSTAGIAVNLDGSTLSIGGSGVSVAKVPNALSQGSGISSFTYDGSATAIISIDTLTVPRLASNNAFSGQNTFSAVNTFSAANSFTNNNTFTGTNTFGTILATHNEVSSGVPYLVAGSNTTVSYNTPQTGQITIAASLGSGSPLTQGTGIATFTYTGASTATVAMDATNLSTSGGRNSYAFLSNGGTTVTKQLVSTLIDEVDRTAIMSEGAGIDITFNGNSNPAVIATKLDGSTISTNGSGNITVNKVPNALSQGTGIKTFSFDGSSAKTVVVDNSVVACLTGSQFSGDVGITGSLEVEKNTILRGLTLLQGKTRALHFTGSLQTLLDGTSYLREGKQISIVTQSNGGILISFVPDPGGESGGGNSDKRAEYLVLTPTGSLTSERVMTTGLGLTSTDGGAGGNYTLKVLDSIVATLTGSVFSGAVTSPAFTGSLQMLSDGTTRYLIGTGTINISTASNGQVIVSGSQGKIYSAGTGLKLASDIFSIDNSIVATLTGSQFSGNIGITGSLSVEGDATFKTGLTGSLQTLSDGATPYIIGTGSISVTTSSLGQLVISSSNSAASDASVSVSQIGGSEIASVSKLVFSASIVTDDGGNQVTIKPVIGSAEDGTYTDGLFTDLTYSTPVGTAVDRFNEVLKGLAPSAAPSLDDMDCDDSGTNAKLSFGSAQSISGYTNAQPSTLTPTDNLSDININGAYSSAIVSNDVRVACFAGATVIDGTLNEDIAADGSNYAANSFGNADQGTLKLFVNNNSTAIHTTNLSSFGSGNSLNGDSSGFNLTVKTAGHFTDGSNFETFQHRQGTYTIAAASQRSGWNYARVVHTIGASDTTCNYVEWVNDPESTALSSDNSAMDTLSMTGTKNLSGVKYNTAGSAQYRIRVLNAYRNVYSTSNITFNGTNASVSSQSFPAIDYGAGENEAKTLHMTGSATITADPILNGSITVSINVPHPLKTNLSSAGSQSISGILLYDLSNTSTTTSESFRAENYRIKSGSYAIQANVTAGSNTWDSTTSLTTVDGMLFYNSRLYSPNQGGASGDFRNTSDGGSIANGPSSNVNYSAISSGLRTFYRYFQNTSGGSKSNWSLTIAGSGTIVSQGTALNSSRIHVLAKLPTTSSTFATGWMDLAVAFATGQVGDAAGCLDGSLDSSLSATNSGTFGTQSVGANEYVVIKIEADAAWTGYISSMSISWS